MNAPFALVTMTLAVGLVAGPAGAQVLRPATTTHAPAPPAIASPPITPAVLPSGVTLRLLDTTTGTKKPWLALPARDMTPVAAVVPASPKIALTVKAVTQEIVTPLNQSLAFSDRRMALSVAVDARTLEKMRLEPDRPRVTIAIRQTHAGVPVEHVGLVVAGVQGESVRTIRGVLIRQWRITNRRLLTNVSNVPDIAYRSLAKQTGVARDNREERAPKPQLVLLPYGNADASTIALRYAWRLPLSGRIADTQVPFVAWMDAESSELLKLIPLYAEVAASASVWRRDPGTGASRSIGFSVDAESAGKFELTLSQFAAPPQVMHSDCTATTNNVSAPNSCTVSIPAINSTLANFDQAPINDAASALCRKWGNRKYQQASVFAQVYAYREQMKTYGVGEPPTPIPAGTWSPRLEMNFCSAEANMLFGACRGYYDDACPDYSDETDGEQNRMNFAHDSTAIAHEFGHAATNNLWDVCVRSPGVPCPVGWSSLHDLADAWAADLENTSCIAGWVAKNVGGVDASNNCTGSRGHGKGDDLPRLLEVSFPFDPNLPGNHFPEHRSAAGTTPSEYRDMQIASTALWLLREAMLATPGSTGRDRYRQLLFAAVRTSGALGTDPGTTDSGIFARLSDFQQQLLLQSNLDTSGTPSATKIMGSFAKVGVFPIDSNCADSGSNCGAAVIEVDDNDPTDEIGARDYIRRDGPNPLFHVWTGPRFRFDSAGSARPLAAQAPCNSSFKIELSSTPDFATGSVSLDSGWLSVGTDASSNPASACYAQWELSDAQWAALRAPVIGRQTVKFFYRVTTRDASNGNERSSLQPTAGINIPAPFAVINLSGQP